VDTCKLLFPAWSKDKAEGSEGEEEIYIRIGDHRTETYLWKKKSVRALRCFKRYTMRSLSSTAVASLMIGIKRVLFDINSVFGLAI
jgi:hypothetical protein